MKFTTLLALFATHAFIQASVAQEAPEPAPAPELAPVPEPELVPEPVLVPAVPADEPILTLAPEFIPDIQMPEAIQAALHDDVEDEFGHLPAHRKSFLAIDPYEENYFLINDSLDAKFQFSLRLPLWSDAPAWWGEDGFSFRKFWKRQILNPLTMTYTQRSFWDLSKPSAPFADHNFRPGISYTIYDKENTRTEVGYYHMSNGRDGEESRSWDRLFLSHRQGIGEEFVIGGKVWHIADVGGKNDDIKEFQGYGELVLEYHMASSHPENEVVFAAKGRVGSKGEHGNYELNAYVPVKAILGDLFNRDFQPRLMLQYWEGYGESLIEYDQRQSRISAGLVFSY